MSEKYLTAQELSELLKITKKTVYNLVAGGKLPSGFKIGRSRRWKMSEIEKAIQDGAIYNGR